MLVGEIEDFRDRIDILTLFVLFALGWVEPLRIYSGYMAYYIELSYDETIYRLSLCNYI